MMPASVESFERRPSEGRRADIVIIADGWSRRNVLELMSEGRLDAIQRYLVDHGGFLADVVSNLPSVSLSSHTSILTSSFQDEHAIVGHRWQDRTSGEITNYLRPSGYREVNRDISPSVQTVLEQDATGSAFSTQGVIDRGATKRRHVVTMRSGPILRAASNLIRSTDASTSTIWLPRVDAVSHSRGPEHSAVKEEMESTSRHLGAFFLELERSGHLDQARVVIVSDHGHEPVGRAIKLERAFAGIGVDVAVNRRRRHGDTALALTSGDRSAHVYLEAPDLERRSLIAEHVLEDPAVELAAWRLSDGSWCFASERGEAAARWNDYPTLSYSVTRGRDPLLMLDEFLGERAALINLTEPRVDGEGYPDFAHQVMRSHIQNRSGDMLLFAAKGTHFGRGPRFGYRLGMHRGSHGGAFPDEVMVAAAYRSPEPIEATPIRSADLLRRLGFISLDRGQVMQNDGAAI